MKKLCALILLACTFSLSPITAQTGTWTALTNLPPHPNYGVCLLMTDGTVICHNQSGGTYGTGWDKLTPDIHGSYINGTWSTIASMNNDRLFFSSQILPDGRVYVAGGEYGAGGPAGGEVYDPVADTWTLCGPIPNGWNIYDGNSEILYNGSVLEGPQIGANPSYDCLFYTPSTNLYTSAPTAFYNHDEAEWLKLRDSSILFVGINTSYGNRYIPKYNKWVYDDTMAGMLYDMYGSEAGCALMLPNGKAIFFGATPYNVIYTPSNDTNHGTWSPADSFPVIQGTYMGQPDASGAMMVNGHILLACSPIGTSPSSEFNRPAYFVEYNYLTNTFTQVKSPIPGQGGDSISNIASYQTQMLDLPDGNVLVSISQTNTLNNQYYIYTPGSGPIAQGKPTINNIIPDGCFFYKITGKLFNGISEGAAYGDDWQMSTNWPLVRLTSGTSVYYAKTSNWNRIGAVRTDSLEDTAYFALPSMPGGTYSVQVVVNGFASNVSTINIFGVAITSQTNVVCNGGSNGSATALGSDGTPPYTYSWAPSGGTNPSASNLSAGIYTVSVVGNGGGCTATATVDITQPAVLGVSVTGSIGCVGGHSGRAMANVAGGANPFTYTWTGGGGTNATATGLSVGTYSVSVKDACGNTASASITLNPYVTLSVTIDSVYNIPCNDTNNDGSANAVVNGGLPTYTYSWSPGGETTATAYGLSAGTYTVNVADSCGNTATASVTITQSFGVIVTSHMLPSASFPCNGSNWVTVSGGTPPYTYLWSPSGATTDSIYGLCAGSFNCCTVNDASGCFNYICDTIQLSTGINNISGGTGYVIVYPNPSNGEFTVSIKNYKLVPIAIGITNSVEVYNVFGQKVYSTPLNLPQGGDFEINLSSQPNGVYFYRVLQEDGSLLGNGKLIIVK